MNILENTYIDPEFSDQGVKCWRLKGRHFENEYYIISEAGTRKLLSTPDIPSQLPLFAAS